MIAVENYLQGCEYPNHHLQGCEALRSPPIQVWKHPGPPSIALQTPGGPRGGEGRLEREGRDGKDRKRDRKDTQKHGRREDLERDWERDREYL